MGKEGGGVEEEECSSGGYLEESGVGDAKVEVAMKEGSRLRDALHCTAAAPNTSNPTASDCTTAAPNTYDLSGPKKRKCPAPKTSNSSGLDCATAAPNASNMNPLDCASAARKAHNLHFTMQAAAACNTPTLNSLYGAAADGPDSNNNNTNLSGSPNVEETASSRREPNTVLDLLLDALGCDVAYS
ncbi:hypothetical protein H4Q26_003719 [Puccinia striiformis f. sp. tritici PST-130]|uniref:Uncharacterized protein n=3 Tax=Puccinia striiformis TaxID=27350 RepID=A0A0L0VSV7_9BASI|nr:hypothetical protein H4Q26_003719 [Puccinia striiformis f. sp. tritici PST-130]KNF02080.1 hypothetical protein PSTG_04578 [Puccinia striiformis f. sp. tritici PST-78]POW09408.1 hypothetical protein PSTT_06825 [Puccinia striiformis]